MAEVVGLTLSIITLVDTCITTCNLISKAKAFPSDLELLHTGLLWEAARLKEWAKSWAIEPNDPTSADRAILLVQEAHNASVDLSLVERILKNAEQLLSRGEKIISKYDEPTSSSTKATSNALAKGIKATVSRATWSVVDHETFRTLVGDLETQNNHLSCVRPRSVTQSTEVQILATTSGALASIDQTGVTPAENAAASYPELAEMLSMRARQDQAESSDLSSSSSSSSSSMYISQAENKVDYDQNLASPARTIGQYCSGPDAENTRVLIEWKYYIGSDSSSRQLAFSRAERISQRLAGSTKPAGFRILTCVGWFVERSSQRCGIMFSVTPTINKNPNLSMGVVTLAEMIRAKTRPTLNDRFRLAFLLSTSLLKLHMARWMHNKVTADNIIFFSSSSSPVQSALLDAVDIKKPYLASFGLARPDHPFESSEAAVSSTPVSKAYQHPSYSKAVAVVHDNDTSMPEATVMRIPRYHKEYDIYSLGCVLFEIGMWRPLGELGWRDSRYKDDLASWRTKLRQKVRENVGFSVGRAYEDVVMSCLGADVEDPWAEEELPEMGSSNSTEAFCWDIVRKLDQLRV